MRKIFLTGFTVLSLAAATVTAPSTPAAELQLTPIEEVALGAGIIGALSWFHWDLYNRKVNAGLRPGVAPGHGNVTDFGVWLTQHPLPQ